ncbi:mandelate racemase/muconate lactonizing enzyme family protein [Jannaschia sp. LMIT008]|uniref:mandelate racemase/muconate lactonizing enzyme family protein n=1 Tax=Jannaschia maritima TaxID=3032585 RepID=UPI002811F16F|nr:mandelate racemase/muconate lactonizing enzyme family protein [Jannaschia sp. LMIT008]
MPVIESVALRMVDLPPKVRRVDAIQTFERQETPVVTITDSEGAAGIGYAYTIGTGGPSVMALLERTLAPLLIGRDADRIDGLWHEMLRATNATAVGAITSLSLAAVDTALWDLRCRRAGLPLWKMAGGARDRVPVYSTEGGWLNLSEAALAEEAAAAREAGFRGAKMKVGLPTGGEDARRIRAVRDAVGPDFEVMVDANQSFDLSEAIRRAAILEEHGIAWFEEPMAADRVAAHRTLARATRVPIAVGESLYSLGQFNEYLAAGAASVVQVDVARVGGVTPWLKVAALAEAHGVRVAPHFLMELHLSLVCAAPAARWLEYIPQLDAITRAPIRMEDGMAHAPDAPGLGIDWDTEAVERLSVHCAEIGRRDAAPRAAE